MQAISSHTETTLRLGFFFGVLIFFALWEFIAPRRKLSVSKSKRWISNLSMVFINSILIRILFPTAAVGVALYTQQHHVGLFNIIHLSHWTTIIASVIILDLVIYLQHVMLHAIPTLWRIHRVHHVDLDIDITTGIRFHPIEIILSLFIKFCAIILIGAPAVSVIIFQILLNITSMFNHSNIYIPYIIDKIIRCITVTPDMHRVHHSDIPHETNCNFGFNLSIWDRIFGTYKAQPQLGHTQMHIGIKTIREERYCMNLWGMLKLPFMKETREYPINRIL